MLKLQITTDADAAVHLDLDPTTAPAPLARLRYADGVPLAVDRA